MINKPRVDPKKLEKFSKLSGEIWTTAGKLTKMYNTLSSQEKALVGGILVQVKNHWNGTKYSGLIGEREAVAMLVQQAVNDIQRPPVPPQPDVFKNEDDITLN